MTYKIVKISDLRKTSTFIEINAKRVGAFNVNAIDTKLILTEDNAVFRTTLKPSGSNQKDDTNETFIENVNLLQEVIFTDKKIRKLTNNFLQAYHVDFQNIKFEIIYKNTHTFNASISSKDQESIALKIKT